MREYPDTHYKMTISYPCIRLFVFVARIALPRGRAIRLFLEPREYADAKNRCFLIQNSPKSENERLDCTLPFPHHIASLLSAIAASAPPPSVPASALLLHIAMWRWRQRDSLTSAAAWRRRGGGGGSAKRALAAARQRNVAGGGSAPSRRRRQLGGGGGSVSGGGGSAKRGGGAQRNGGSAVAAARRLRRWRQRDRAMSAVAWLQQRGCFGGGGSATARRHNLHSGK